MQNFCKR